MRVGEFELIDLGYDGRLGHVVTECHHYGLGQGSECESALDDLQHNLQERGYDVTGLESRIKEEWNPEPERESGLYLLAIVFKVEK